MFEKSRQVTFRVKTRAKEKIGAGEIIAPAGIVSVKNLACYVRNVSKKLSAFCIKSYVCRGFVYIAYVEIISRSREVALPHFSAISP